MFLVVQDQCFKYRINVSYGTRPMFQIEPMFLVVQDQCLKQKQCCLWCRTKVSVSRRVVCIIAESQYLFQEPILVFLKCMAMFLAILMPYSWYGMQGIFFILKVVQQTKLPVFLNEVSILALLIPLLIWPKIYKFIIKIYLSNAVTRCSQRYFNTQSNDQWHFRRKCYTIWNEKIFKMCVLIWKGKTWNSLHRESVVCAWLWYNSPSDISNHYHGRSIWVLPTSSWPFLIMFTQGTHSCNKVISLAIIF